MKWTSMLALLPLGACTGAALPPPSSARVPAQAMPLAPATRILDRAAADRLLAADGATLQWIGWDTRGVVRVVEEDGTIRLDAAQDQTDGPGRMSVSGTVTEIGAGYFILDGEIRITDTPDPGRQCVADKPWHFAVTQNRPYWRLREFEWCDGLTDYIDIYMAKAG